MEPLYFMLGGVVLFAFLFAAFARWHDRRLDRRSPPQGER
jgi:hypothetical protein